MGRHHWTEFIDLSTFSYIWFGLIKEHPLRLIITHPDDLLPARALTRINQRFDSMCINENEALDLIRKNNQYLLSTTLALMPITRERLAQFL